jgi:hypothetical protein
MRDRQSPTDPTTHTGDMRRYHQWSAFRPSARRKPSSSQHVEASFRIKFGGKSGGKRDAQGQEGIKR